MSIPAPVNNARFLLVADPGSRLHHANEGLRDYGARCRRAFSLPQRNSSALQFALSAAPCAHAHRLVSGGNLYSLTTIAIHVSREPELRERPNYYWASSSHQFSRSPLASPPLRQARSVSALHDRSVRHETVFQELPERDRQSAGEGDNADLAAAHAGAAEALAPPDR